MTKVVSFADIYYIRTESHKPTNVSPITMVASLHFETAINNFGIQEFMRHTYS